MSELIQRHENTQSRKPTKAEVQKKVESQKERDNELVTGIFRYLEHPRGTLNFRYKKYHGDPYRQYSLVDGQKYKLPRMVARHLNNDVHYMEYKRLDRGLGDEVITSMNNNPGVTVRDGVVMCNDRMSIAKKVHRCEFRSLEFMDEDIESSNLVQVTKN